MSPCLSLFYRCSQQGNQGEHHRLSKLFLQREKYNLFSLPKKIKFSQQSYKCFPILQYKFGVFVRLSGKICRIKRQVEVFKVCFGGTLFRIFSLFSPLFFCCFFTSKNRLFDMLEKIGVLLGQNGVLFYQKGVSRK